MIIDKYLQLSDNQAITATAASENVIDAGGAVRDLGGGEPLYAVFSVTQSFTVSTGTPTLTLAVQDSADNGTFVNVVATAPIALAELKVGKQVVLALPPGLRRYLRANYTASAAFTGGKVSAQIVRDYAYAPSLPDEEAA
jgi:hypothetical protein